MSNLFNAFESQIKEFDNEVAKLRAENAEKQTYINLLELENSMLRKLVPVAYCAGWNGAIGFVDWKNPDRNKSYAQWVEQHPILKEKE